MEIGLLFEAATLVGLPLFVDEPSRLAPEILRVNNKVARLPPVGAAPEEGCEG